MKTPKLKRLVVSESHNTSNTATEEKQCLSTDCHNKMYVPCNASDQMHLQDIKAHCFGRDPELSGNITC